MERQLLRHHARVAYPRSTVRLGRGSVDVFVADVVARGAIH